MFKVGQKVVCISNSKKKHLIIDKIYTVTSIDNVCNCGTGINVDYIKHSSSKGKLLKCLFCGENFVCDGFVYFFPYRFRPIDFSFGEKLAEEIQTEINEEQLVNA